MAGRRNDAGVDDDGGYGYGEGDGGGEEEHHVGQRVILALCYSARMLGVAAYDERSATIFAEAVSVNIDALEGVLSALKLALCPTLLVLHPQILDDQSLLAACIANPHGQGEGGEAADAYEYQSLKTGCWRVEAARDVIVNKLWLRTEKPEDGMQAHFSILTSRANLNSPQLSSALGALVVHLQATIFLLEVGKVTVSSILPLPSLEFMRVDDDSLRALNIFATDIHPNVIKGRGREKEGFSLFSLLDRTKSKSGRRRLKDWMRRPFTDIESISLRLDGVSIATDGALVAFATECHKQLRKWSDAPTILGRLRRVEATPKDWCLLFTSLQHGLMVAAAMMEQAVALDQASAVADGAAQRDSLKGQARYLAWLQAPVELTELNEVLEAMAAALDTSSMQSTGSIVIRAGYDAGLDALRKTYDHLDEYLGQAASASLDLHPRLQSLGVEYVPQVGYLLSVPAAEAHLLEPNRGSQPQHQQQQQEQLQEQSWGVGGGIGGEGRPDSDTVQVFADQGKLYFKSNIMERLDVELGDLKSDIADAQKALLLAVEEKVLAADSLIMKLDECLSSLDAVLAMGSVSRERGFVRPELTLQRILAVKNARHPLQELVVDSFIPNDVYIDTTRSVGLITGPNCSGKSVYLKTVGLIVYMAALGCFVPATRALVGVCDSIFTRISTIESQATPLSSFAQDLTQMARLLSLHTGRSLCLVDEFGKGTSPADGIALLAAVVQDLASSPQQAKPFCIFALHFTEIFHPRVLPESVRLAIFPYQMTTMSRPAAPAAGIDGGGDSNDEDDDDGPTPLFKLLPGVAADSQGIACAHKAGLPQSVVERAKLIRQCVENRVSVPVRPTESLGSRVGTGARDLLREFLQSSPQQWAAADSAKLAALRVKMA